MVTLNRLSLGCVTSVPYWVSLILFIGSSIRKVKSALIMLYDLYFLLTPLRIFFASASFCAKVMVADIRRTVDNRSFFILSLVISHWSFDHDKVTWINFKLFF